MLLHASTLAISNPYPINSIAMNTASAAIPYPTQSEVEAWLESIWALADSMTCEAEPLLEQGFSASLSLYNANGSQYIRFSPSKLDPFYGYWQPTLSSPAPLLIHLPGYGAEVSAHPELYTAGFNVLHISPLGYATPKGFDLTKRRNDNWPVLPDTIHTGGQKGYREWLANCVMAIRWALTQPGVIKDRVSFFGTSQGGGTALLLGSLYKDLGVRCVAADVPYLTDFPVAIVEGTYPVAADALKSAPDKAVAWHAFGLIDTISHAHRLDIPVLLTAGGADDICPPSTIEKLFHRLPGTRSYTYLKTVGHRYTVEFIPLAKSWFRLYA